jgi:cytochrome c oxidase subunit 3
MSDHATAAHPGAPGAVGRRAGRAGTRQPGLAHAHHWRSYDEQREASFLGMWLFLITEIMFFGGLFTAYVVYRAAHTEAFKAASHHLDIRLGTINTAVLIASSLTMALAVWGAQIGRRKTLTGFLIATIALGSVFLGIKAIEYGHKFEEGHLPGPAFHWDAEDPAGAQMFFNLYFALTGLHALHMVIGIAVLLALVYFAAKGIFTPENHNLIEGMGLYWHFVDIVWIFLFPLLYLLGRAG